MPFVKINLFGRDFLKEVDFTPEEWNHLLELAGELKAATKEGREERRLQGLNIALLFEKMSTPTRCSFEVALYQQGARTRPTSIRAGRRWGIRSSQPTPRAFCSAITTASSSAVRRSPSLRSSPRRAASPCGTGGPTSGTPLRRCAMG